MYAHALRLTARILVFAAWSALFVLAILFVASQGMSLVADATGAGPVDGAHPMQALLGDGLLLYAVGIGAFGTGVLLITVGWSFIKSALP